MRSCTIPSAAFRAAAAGLSVGRLATVRVTLATAMPLWSTHPRVFLDFGHDGLAKCPYCGTEYRLKPGTVMAHH